MNEYPLHIKNCLLAAISQITARKDEFVKHPGRDFSRNRKISLNRMIFFLVGAEASTMQFELQKFSFLFPKSISGLPSCSAMFQRRSRLSGDAMPAVFDEFNKQFPRASALHRLAWRLPWSSAATALPSSAPWSPRRSLVSALPTWTSRTISRHPSHMSGHSPSYAWCLPLS